MYISDARAWWGTFKGSVSLEAFKMYYVICASAPSLHRESTESLITDVNIDIIIIQ